MTLPLQGQLAVVTGASRGIGQAIAGALAQAGARVVGCSVTGPFDDQGRAPGFLQGLREAQHALFSCDVRKTAEVQRFAARVQQDFGVPDILCNNAGNVVRAAIVDLTDEQWDDVIATNLRSTFLVTRAFLPAMKARGRGRIVNVSSIAGRQGTPMLSAYCAAKHGVVGFTRALAEELRGHGLQANVVCPGSVDTDMLKIGMPGGTPNMSPADVAQAVLFLAASAPAALTGSCLDVFG